MILMTLSTLRIVIPQEHMHPQLLRTVETAGGIKETSERMRDTAGLLSHLAHLTLSRYEFIRFDVGISSLVPQSSCPYIDKRRNKME